VVTDAPRRHAHRPELDLLREVCAYPASGRGQRRSVHTGRPARAGHVERDGVEGMIVGKALYAGAFTIAQALAVLCPAGETR
jgi:phosphoribosylanthranilate isomerase